MGTILRLLTLQVLSPVLRPLVRLIVGIIAIPIFRLFVRRVVKVEQLGAELTKDLEQWVRGSVLLLFATANVENALFGNAMDDWRKEYVWVILGMRLLLAVGVIEAMPDQALFSIIHPGPSRLLLPKGRRMKAVREQWWPFCKGMFCRHLDRSSSVFAIMSVIFGGRTHQAVGWGCYLLAIIQFFIIGLVSSRDKALDVLSEFDEQVQIRRQELVDLAAPGNGDHPLDASDDDRESTTHPHHPGGNGSA